MSEVYQLSAAGPIPFTVEELKAHLKLEVECDDDYLTELLVVATQWGEKYTRRDFRANTWTLTLDCFPARICLRRDPVVSVASIVYLNDATPTPGSTTVPTADYYLKAGTQTAEILETPTGDSWPTDINDLEASIVVTFVSGPADCLEIAKQAIKRHAAFLYENRGDCPEEMADSARRSGATTLYGPLRIVRV